MKHATRQTDQDFRDDEYKGSTDYGLELWRRIREIGCLDPKLTLVDFESFLPRGKDCHQFLVLLADVRAHLAQTKLDNGCWGKR